MRALGLDVGSKTIGVALSDELGLAAHPLETIARAGTKPDVARVLALIAEHDVRAVVIGLPLELSGRVGPRARRVRVFVDALRDALRDALADALADAPANPATDDAQAAAGLAGPVAIHEWDERFSTVAVERVLIEADLSRRRRKQVIDRQAAAYILQGWLDAERRTAH